MKNTQDDVSAEAELTVGQVAAKSGLAVSAIHFYEDKGLISSRRTPGRRRRYSYDVLQRVIVIKAAQSVGIHLSTVRDMLLLLPGERKPTAADWGALLSQWRTDLEASIRDLATLRDELGECSRCGCLSFESCPLIVPPARTQAR